MSFFIYDIEKWLNECSSKRRLRRFRPYYCVEGIDSNSLGIETADLQEVSDAEVIRAIKTIPMHFSTISYQQTDTVSVDTGPAFVDPFAFGITTGRQMQVGGSAGTATYTGSISNAADNVLAMWETPVGVPGLTSWPAGTYTGRIHVTAADDDLSLTQFEVIRVNSSGVTQARFGASVPLSRVTVGVLELSFAGTAQAANVSDRLVMQVVCDELNNMTSITSYKSDQLIDTPFGALTYPIRWRVGPRTPGLNIWDLAPGIVA